MLEFQYIYIYIYIYTGYSEIEDISSDFLLFYYF